MHPEWLVIVTPVQREADACLGQQAGRVGGGAPVLAEPPVGALTGAGFDGGDGLLQVSLLHVQGHVTVHHAGGCQAMGDPLAVPLPKDIHQAWQTLHCHGVGRNHGPDAGIAQSFDDTKNTHTQPILALRPAAVVGREAAKLTDHARVAQGV